MKSLHAFGLHDTALVLECQTYILNVKLWNIHHLHIPCFFSFLNDEAFWPSQFHICFMFHVAFEWHIPHRSTHKKNVLLQSVSTDSVSICFSSQKCHFVMDLNLKKGLRLVIHADRSADTQNTFIVLEFTKNRFEEELNKEKKCRNSFFLFKGKFVVKNSYRHNWFDWFFMEKSKQKFILSFLSIMHEMKWLNLIEIFKCKHPESKS